MYTKIPPPQGWLAAHRCAICNGRFELGQQFWNYGHGEVVHTKCRFQKQGGNNE